MEKRANKISKNIMVFMLIVLSIGWIQNIGNEANNLANIRGLAYSEKLVRLYSTYRIRYVHRYYDWLNLILPPDQSFSILFDQSARKDYGGYKSRFNYFFYPRYVLPSKKVEFNHKTGKYEDIEKDVNLNNIKHSDIVLILNTKNINFNNMNGFKYVYLGDRRYYLVAVVDEKGLIAERSFILKNITHKSSWNMLREEFKKLYGNDINKVVF